MKIREIDLNSKKDVKKYVAFPFQLYKENKFWVPPFVQSAKNQLDPDIHPYYLHSDANFFIVEDKSGKVLGRIGLFENNRYNKTNNINCGLFSHFDVINDKGVSNILFEKAFEWGGKRNLEYLIGPKGMISADVDGILVEGFDHRSAMGAPYNYPYYQDFIESIGFQKERDVLSGYIHIPSVKIPDRIIRISERIKKQRGFWVKQAKNKEEMREMVPEFIHLMNKVFEDGFGFYPYTEEEFYYVAEDIIAICDPELVKVVMKGEKMIGFLIAYHDISKGMQKARGRMWPFGWLYLLIDRKRTKWINVNGLGVLPEYQGLGGNAVLYAEMANTVLSHGFEYAETVSVGEENYRSFSDNITFGVTWYKRHRLYKCGV